jgi:hypothetical protein
MKTNLILAIALILSLATNINAAERAGVVEKDGITYVSVQKVTVSLPNMQSIAEIKVWVSGQDEPLEWMVYTRTGMSITLPEADGIVCLYFKPKDVFGTELQTKSGCVRKFVQPESVDKAEVTDGKAKGTVPLKPVPVADGGETVL